MKEYIMKKNDAGQRLDRWLRKNVPMLPPSLEQKYFRNKRIKLNGQKVSGSQRLLEDDVLTLYINDEYFEKPVHDFSFLSNIKPNIEILYEDNNILIVNKPSGQMVHPDDKDYRNTLLTQLQAYLYQKKEWLPDQENSFSPALCNRIDRNTSGIVIAAKNAESLRIMNQKIRDRELNKFYICAVSGIMSPADGELKGYLLKDRKNNQVKMFRHPVENGRTCITRYRTLAVKNNISLIECDLITGRTHQIRAQFASAGHPLIGDGKYGREKINRKFGMKKQALCSYRLVFNFTTDAGILEYLNHHSWQLDTENISFVKSLFPDWKQVP